MAKAFKCDVCKTYYENDTYPIVTIDGFKYGQLQACIKNSGTARVVEFDLCPDCKNRLVRFLRIPEDKQKGFKND